MTYAMLMLVQSCVVGLALYNIGLTRGRTQGYDQGWEDCMKTVGRPTMRALWRKSERV